MNLLLFEAKDLNAARELSVVGVRARHLVEVLRVSVGQQIRVGEINGGTAEAEVISKQSSKDGPAVVLRIPSYAQAPALAKAPEKSKVHLLLAMPRPQSLKKVLQSGATLGLDSISIISAERVERSYFSSPLLQPGKFHEQLLLGMEQGASTALPQVVVQPGVKPLQFGTSRPAGHIIEEISAQCGHLFVADPTAAVNLLAANTASPVSKSEEILLAIGPEGGWLPAELEKFSAMGFCAVSLGDRLMRVETAVCVILSQIDMLRQLGDKRFGAHSVNGRRRELWQVHGCEKPAD